MGLGKLSNTCLFAKMVKDPLDLRTIISRTKADWKMVRGDVEYLEGLKLGNQWILLKFANFADKGLVWEERPWHVQGELPVLQPWRRFFDPFLEEIKNVNLWICIPRFPSELLNAQSIASLFESDHIDVGSWKANFISL